MHTYTALYDNRQDAEAAQAELTRLGIIEADANIADQSAFEGRTGQAGGTQAAGDDKGVWGSLKGAFVPEEDRRIYETGVREGGYLLTVNVDDQNADRVHDLLERSNAVDLDEREAQYRKTGLLPPADMSAGQTSMGRTENLSGGRTENLSGGEQTIPVVEEQIKVGKREVSRGGVRVRSYIVETPVHEQVRLRDEHVEVERRPVDQPLRAGLSGAEGLLQERTIEMTETSEEAVVAKEARVVEEVVLRKQSGEHVETIDDTVRRTEVEVERTDPTGKGQAR